MPKESVWEYPRPPRLEPVTRRIRIEFAGETIADTTRAYRVLETSHPPVYYIPPEDIRMEFLRRTPGSSFCEWKGEASYWTLAVNTKRADKAAWSYDSPTRAFQPILGYLAFYPSRVDACWVDDEEVQAQPGDFYGGWITSDITGPFKGGAGTYAW